MIYDVNKIYADRDRLLWELEQCKLMPETIHKRNRLNDLQYQLDQLNGLVERYNTQMQLHTQRQPQYQYNTQAYGSPYNVQVPNTPMVYPVQSQPMYSPYSSASMEQPRPVISTNSSAAHRYARKELPEQFKNAKVINNEPPGSYIVKAEPPKPVKKYTKDSKYPILCDISRKEIEIQLETGYIQREVEYNKENGFNELKIGGIDPLICVKAKHQIESIGDFFNMFKDKVTLKKNNISTYQLFSYIRTNTFILPYEINNKLKINDYKKLQDELTEENIFDSLRMLNNNFNGLDKYLDKRYTDLFNSLVKYSYNFDLECDSFLQDAGDLKSEISKIKLVKDREKYKEILNVLVNDFKSIAIELVEEKYIKIQFKDPELLTDCPLIYEALSKQEDVTCLRSNSYETLYQRFIELFKFYGENTKTVKFITVNDHMEMRRYTVYNCGAGVETQFIVVRDK